MTKLLIATDAWGPQINGVVRSLENIAAHAAAFGVDVRFLTPTDFWTLPLPGYREIRLALANPRRVAGFIGDFNPDFIHIATEGPIGLATRRACLAGRRTFTTSYHTRFPEYVAARLPVPVRVSYAALRRFHSAAAGTMVSSPSLEHVLTGHGFRNLMRWSRGVDGTLFRPRPENALAGLPRPIFLFVGRLAVEKNIEAFLKLDLPGSKVVVGDGPLQMRLAASYPKAHFLGTRSGEALAQIYSSADVFVFPEPNGYVRYRSFRGFSLGRAGRRLPGHRAARRHRRIPAPASSATICARRRCTRSTFPASIAANMRPSSPGRKARGNSSTISAWPRTMVLGLPLADLAEPA